MRMPIIVGAVAAWMLSGCAHTERPREVTVTALVQEVKVLPPKPQLVATPRAVQSEDPMVEIDAALRSATVLFNFNGYQLNPKGLEALQKVALVLRKHPNVAVKIEGNCDERGTEEYNLMLGQRRAAAAQKYLVDLGVAPRQLETFSFGALRPVDSAHSEEAWSRNRRDELHAAR